MSKTFRRFPNLKMTVNAFTEVITGHKVEEYKDKLQGLLEEFQTRFDDLQELKPCFTFLVNPFCATYCCESLFSVMKFVKSKYRASQQMGT